MTGPIVNKPRKNVIAVRLSDDEAAMLDQRRGDRSKTEYMRELLLRDAKRQNDALLSIYEQTLQQGEQTAPDGSTVIPNLGPEEP